MRKRSPTLSHSPTVRGLIDLANQSERTYEDIAEKAGTYRKTITDMKRNCHKPSIYTVENLGQVLGYRLEWVKL